MQEDLKITQVMVKGAEYKCTPHFSDFFDLFIFNYLTFYYHCRVRSFFMMVCPHRKGILRPQLGAVMTLGNKWAKRKKEISNGNIFVVLCQYSNAGNCIKKNTAGLNRIIVLIWRMIPICNMTLHNILVAPMKWKSWTINSFKSMTPSQDPEFCRSSPTSAVVCLMDLKIFYQFNLIITSCYCACA